MKVPFIFLQQENNEFRNALLSKISTVLEKSNFILGDEVKTFEKSIADKYHFKYVLGVNSGTDALFLSLLANNISKNDEVITVSNSFIATANAISLIGAKPIFVDIKDNLLIDEEKIEESITLKTKALIVVHLTGKPANMHRITQIAKDYNLVLIEDSAQAIGAKYNNKFVGSFGIGCFSLHPLKNLSACGDAGIISLKTKLLFNKISALRNHGLINRNETSLVGYNSRLDEIQASILNVKINYIDEINNKRRQNAEYYYKALSSLNIDSLIYIPKDEKNEYSVYHTFIIRVKQRDKLLQYLLDNGIEVKVHYPLPIHQQRPYLNHNFKLPKTEQFAKEIISLPIHQYLNQNHLDYVIEKIKDFYVH